ncbi:MAG: hypothetical protein AB1938_22405 [Myxococcota bacterium]
MKTARFLLFAGFLLGLGVSLADCGGGSSQCNPTTCPNGCCNGAGQCTDGTTTLTCGKGGIACAQCAPGVACVQQSCGGSGTGGGTGGGATGGGSGGGATGGGSGGGATGGGTGGGATGGGTGGGYTCSSVKTFGTFVPSQVTSVRQRVYSDGTVENRVRFDADPDAGVYVYQHVFFDPAVDMPPLTYDLGKLPDGGALTWLESYETGTAMALSDCDVDGTCSRLYLSQGGTSTWTAVGSSAAGGRMAGSAATIRLVEWDWQYDSMRNRVIADQPVANPICIDVAAWSFDLEYSASADGGYVVPFDAGM